MNRWIDLLASTEEFHLTIDTGEFTDSEIIVMLGENGNDLLLLFIYLFIYLLQVSPSFV